MIYCCLVTISGFRNCLWMPQYIIMLLCLGWKSRDSVPILVERYLEKKMKVDEFVTHTMTLDKINEGFDLMHAGKRYFPPSCNA